MGREKYQDVSEVLGLRIEETSPYGMVELSRRGVPRYSLDKLAAALHSSPLEVAKFLPVSPRTLQRYESTETLSPAISDHVIQIAKLVARTTDVFGNADKAVAWLKEKNVALGGVAPMELFDTYSGIDLVLGELTRTEHGVVS